MADDTSDAGLSNPFSTGGGGHQYEQRVASHYLVSLLAGDIPRGLARGITQQVALQRRWDGACVDDIAVTASDQEHDYHLFLQVKHELTFTANDGPFTDVIKQGWQTLVGAGGGTFDEERDRLGIVVNGLSQTARLQLLPLLEWARTSLDAKEFFTKVERVGSDRKSGYIVGLRSIVGRAQAPSAQPVAGQGGAEDPAPATTPPGASDDDLWRLLRVLVVIDFDFGHAGSRDATWTWNRLLDQLPRRAPETAVSLADSLFSMSSEAAKSAGSFDLGGLRTALASAGLVSSASHALELRRLRAHADDVLGDIRDSIGGRVRLPRTELLAALQARVLEKDVVLVLGEPMAGKSALLKSLVQSLRSEGECLAMSVDRLQGRSLTAFLGSLGITTRFGELLVAAGAAPSRCVVCDGLDRAWDEDRRRLISELVTAIGEHNRQLAERNVHPSFRWRLVLTARVEEARHLLGAIPALRSCASLVTLEVGPLTQDELGVVATELPFLAPALATPQLQPVLAKPFVLDILTISDITHDFDPVSPPLTEGRLSRWYWQHVVRLSERRGTGRGHPDDREAILLALARQLLDRAPLRPPSDCDREALDGLTSDRVVVRDGSRWRVSHDAIADWALSMLLHGDDLVPTLEARAIDFRLDRVVALLSERLLDRGDRDGWLSLLQRLAPAEAGSPRWRESCILPVARSARAHDFLALLGVELLRAPGLLLSELAQVVLQRCVRPSAEAEKLFPPGVRKALEDTLVYWTDPVPEAWTPLLEFLVAQRDHVPEDALAAVGSLVSTWLSKRTGDPQLRRALTTTCQAWLDCFDLWDHYEESPRDDLVGAVLWAADVMPVEVSKVVERHAASDRKERSRGMEEVLLKNGWIPLVRALPCVARAAFMSILCESLEPDTFGEWSYLEHSLGIQHVFNWSTPSPETGPFFALLAFHPSEGLGLIKDLVRHATRAWRIREERSHRHERRTPVPHQVRIADQLEEVWGDDRVYCWHRYPSCGPTEVTCALMALEAWLVEQVKEGRDARTLFRDAISQSESVALVGVCVSVSLALPDECAGAALPLLGVPAFWLMDEYRQLQDLGASGSIEALARLTPGGGSRSRRARELAEQGHRRRHMCVLATWIILRGMKRGEDLAATLRTFPQHVPVYFAEEREDAALLETRGARCREWSRLAERENYVLRDLGDRRAEVHLIPSEEARERAARAEQRLEISSLQFWAEQFLREGVRGERFAPASALVLARQLASEDAGVDARFQIGEEAAQRAMTVALVAAALVVREAPWTQAQEDGLAWCREQLLEATRRDDLLGVLGSPLAADQPFPMAYDRAAARGLPALLAIARQDPEVREAILDLSSRPSVEVRALLLTSLRGVWPGEPELGWDCLYATLLCAHAASIHRGKGRLAPLSEEAMGTLEAALTTLATLDDVTFASDILAPAITVASTDLLEALEGQHRERVLNLADSLLAYTINCYAHHRRRKRSAHSDYNEWEASTHWNLPLFQNLAGLLLVLPAPQAEPLLARVRAAWPREPDLLEQLLSSLVALGTNPRCEARLFQLWNGLADEVLCTLERDPAALEGRARSDLLRVLLFEVVGITWLPEARLPMETMPWIERWVTQSGASPECFHALVGLLTGPGRHALLTHGLAWLDVSMRRPEDLAAFLKRSGAATTLTMALRAAWSPQTPTLLADAASLTRFVSIVDMLAVSGERLAIVLQEYLAQASKRGV